jgi:RimJ/RimL family protein N-acetyltransferase
MQFTWVDYPSQYADEIETWCDEAALKFALDKKSLADEHQMYLDEEYRLGYNYYCKIILDGDTPVAVLMLAMDEDSSKVHLTEDIVYVETLIINPALRGKGYGAKIMTELLKNQLTLIDHDHNIFVSQIRKDNDVSKKLMQKLGFTYMRFEGDEDNDWFNWVYPESCTERFAAYWDELEDDDEDEE